ncbi:N-acetyltransferase [Paenibacillus sp. GCM10027626]|uniref:N-acetyltransferase n=1 Tax=Paenibacillus sp. GCM10027626 TaxID=3273411 RepID=UPI003625ABE3
MHLPIINERLAKRIQQSEVDYFTSRISSIGERSGNPEGVEIKRFNGSSCTAFYIKSMPWALFNSIKGFAQADLGNIEEIITFYRDRERRFQLDIDPFVSSPQLLRQLAENGLFQESFHSVLYGLPCRERPALPDNIDIHETENEADFDLYAEIHCVGAGMDIAHKHHFANNNIGLLHRAGWKLFLAYWNGLPAAVSVMHINDNIASFTLAATAPQFRRNGLQTALCTGGCMKRTKQIVSSLSHRRTLEAQVSTIWSGLGCRWPGRGLYGRH